MEPWEAKLSEQETVELLSEANGAVSAVPLAEPWQWALLRLLLIIVKLMVANRLDEQTE